MACLLGKDMFTCRVSSVLNRDIKQYGKQNLFDDCDDTCWNSDQGTPQWILIEFKDQTTVGTFCLQFQGGFAGRDCDVAGGLDRTNIQVIEAFYPEDNNTLQSFKLTKPVCVKCLRFSFNSSTDFFGRIVLYKLDVQTSDL